MIYTHDNFIDKDLFNIACNYLKKGEFIKHTVGEKNFYVQESPSTFDEYVDLIHDLNPPILITGSDAVFRLNLDASRSDLNFPNPYWLSSNHKKFKKISRADLI